MKRVILYMASFLVSHASIAQNADINIAKAINQNETAFKNSYAKFCSKTTTSFSFASPLTILSVGLITKNKALQKDAIYLAGSYVASTIVTQAAKHIIQRERPYQKYNFITQRTNADANTSMPSGHTSAAFCMATSLSLRYKKWYIIVPAYLYAGSVAWARMYQGVHYPSDVFIGALIGAGSAWAGLKIQQLINKKHRK